MDEILRDLTPEFREIIKWMVFEELDNLCYDLNDKQCNELNNHVLSFESIRKKLNKSNIHPEFKKIRDEYLEQFKPGKRFDLSVKDFKEKGYSERFFDEEYIDFLALYGKLNEIDDIDYTIDLYFDISSSESETVREYEKYFWVNGIYVKIYKNGEIFILLNGDYFLPGQPNDFTQLFTFLSKVKFKKINEKEVKDFFLRNQDIPIVYEF